MKKYLILIVLFIISAKALEAVFSSDYHFIVKALLCLAFAALIFVASLALYLHARTAINYTLNKAKFVELIIGNYSLKEQVEFKRGVAESSAENFQIDLINRFIEFSESSNNVYFRLDWQAVDEVEAQAAAILKAYHVTADFSLSVKDDSSVEMLILELQHWLDLQGYCYLDWDQGSDEYCGLIWRRAEADCLMALAGKLDIKITHCLKTAWAKEAQQADDV
ncbi:MAG: hypothetical protein OFPII_22670 [Osedax symbiont Rs1]|nr:MAG: hypothetical protein OFPII_22670 [Osedax symbiont Rs1]